MASFASLELPSVPALVEQPAPAPVVEPPAKPRSARYQSLDLWRGAACMMLVLYHTSFYVPCEFSVRDWSTWSIASAAVKTATLLWIGVPIFFVVSGYCIAASVDARNRRPYSLKTYFGRRMWRIYPPLWIACIWAIGVTWMISCFWPNLYEACRQLPRWEDWSPWNWVGNFTATESWHHHATGSRVQYLMNNTWTLCYEEQFYAVVGLLLVIATRRFFTGVVVLTGLTLICRHAGRWHDLELAGWFFEGHWLLFATGILLYYQLTHAGRAGWWSILGFFLLGIAYAAVDRSLVPGDENDRHFDEYIVIACAFAMLLLGVRRWDSACMNAKLLRPLQWCGRRSYSIYLTHFPAVAALSCLMAQIGFTTPWQWLFLILPACVAVALVLGWLFHILVERHFLNAPV